MRNVLKMEKINFYNFFADDGVPGVPALDGQGQDPSFVIKHNIDAMKICGKPSLHFPYVNGIFLICDCMRSGEGVH